MMPEWHQLNSSCTMSEQQESLKKKKHFKIKFQVILVFYWTYMEASWFMQCITTRKQINWTYCDETKETALNSKTLKLLYVLLIWICILSKCCVKCQADCSVSLTFWPDKRFEWIERQTNKRISPYALFHITEAYMWHCVLCYWFRCFNFLLLYFVYNVAHFKRRNSRGRAKMEKSISIAMHPP